MSHFKKYQCKITNQDFLKKALKEMGYDYEHDAVVTDFFKQKRKVEIAVLSNKKRLPLGFTRNKEGLYDIVADWYGINVNQENFTNRLHQLNTKYLVEKVCDENSWNIDENFEYNNVSGEIQVRAYQYA